MANAAELEQPLCAKNAAMFFAQRGCSNLAELAIHALVCSVFVQRGCSSLAELVIYALVCNAFCTEGLF